MLEKCGIITSSIQKDTESSVSVHQTQQGNFTLAIAFNVSMIDFTAI